MNDRSMTRLVASCMFVWLLVCAPAAWLAAQKGARLSGVVRPLNPSPRNAAPWPAEIEIDSTFGHVLSGRLLITFRGALSVVARVVVDPVAIAPGKQVLRRLMPPIIASPGMETVDVEVHLATDSRVLPVTKRTVRAASDHFRRLVVAVVEARVGAAADGRIRSFSLERWLRSPDTRVPTIGTHYVHVPAARVPDDATTCLAYDVVVLAGAAIGRLTEAQRAALGSWVRGGGALGVMATDPIEATEAHARWLCDLTGETFGDAGSGIAFEDGMLKVTVPARFAGLECGVGRIAIFAPSHLEPPARGAPAPVEWLWRLRASPTPTDDGFSPSAANFENDLVRALMPAAARPVPLPLLALILIVFVIAIGPGDWWLLGRLGRRWLTWILFPVLCVLFAIGTMWISEAFLGVNDSDREVVIVDLDRRGKPVRETRLRVLFNSSEGDVTLRYDGYVVSEIVTGRYRGTVSPIGDAADEPMTYRGRVGGALDVSRRVYKWAPVVVRAFRFGSDETVPTLDWNLPGDGIFRPLGDNGGLIGVANGTSIGSRDVSEIAQTAQQFTFWQATAVFHDVFQLSPCGGDHLGGLAMADVDQGDRVGIAIIPDGKGGWRVFRQRL